jgi:hypothetical protein
MEVYIAILPKKNVIFHLRQSALFNIYIEKLWQAKLNIHLITPRERGDER